MRAARRRSDDADARSVTGVREHHYALATEWVLASPLAPVFDALRQPESWPAWWRYVQGVTLLAPGDADGLGAVRRYTWTSRLPYRLTFDMTTTRIEPPTALEGVASGEVRGTGCWRLWLRDGRAHVRYDWTVATQARWMNALAPLLARLFAWNHDQVMAAGGRGLARHLGVPLLAHHRLARRPCTTC
jgi:hypothetical protein